MREHDWTSTTFPDVALFVDSAWRAEASVEQDGQDCDGILTFWATATEYAGIFVEAVQERIAADCYNTRTGSK